MIACRLCVSGCAVPSYQRGAVVRACVACGRQQLMIASGEGGAMMLASGEEGGAVASGGVEQEGTSCGLLCSAVKEGLQYAAVVG